MILIIYTAPLHGAELHSFRTQIHPVRTDFCHQTRNRVNRLKLCYHLWLMVLDLYHKISFMVQELPNIVVGCLCV
ncbi:hypothetical protein Hanom_Chr07g00652791 [Helianthus anomalus]